MKKSNFILKLLRINLHHIKIPSIIGYKDQSGVFYFGIALMSQNNQTILNYYTGSTQFLVLSEQDELYTIIAHTTHEYAEMTA